MLNIFNQKLNNNKSTVVCSISKKEKLGNDLGKTRHYPAANKEWFNSIYTFNKNPMKLLPVWDKVVCKLIRSYFNFYCLSFENKAKIAYLRTRFRRLSINRILVSRPELKHTNDKVVVTLYVYNGHKQFILNKLKNTESIALLEKLPFMFTIGLIKSQGLKIIDKVRQEKDLFIDAFNLNLKKTNFENYENKYLENFIEKSLQKEIFSIYYKHLLYFNKSKFENTYLLGLNNLISKIYRKKVEFNIVSLKYLYLSSDLLTQSIVMKLKNRKNSLLNVLASSLNMVQLPIFNKIVEGFDLSDKPKRALLKNKNLNLNMYLTKKNNNNEKLDNKDLLDQLLQKIFSYSPHSLIEKQQKQLIKSNNHNTKSLIKNNVLEIENNVLNSIKHRALSGVRLEATGRLSRRLTASRSVFKIKYIGSLRNIDSSYKNLSAVMLRGHAKSNVQYTLINSKTRNGSFGLKGWVSSK